MFRRLKMILLRMLIVYPDDGYNFRVYMQTFLAAARIMQAGAENGSRIQVNNQHIFFKLFGTRDQLSLLIKDHAATIKNQFILTSHHIQIGHDHITIRCTSRQHHFTKSFFAGIVGRAIDIYDHLGSRVCLQSHWASRIPHILADSDANMHSIDEKDRRLVSRLEVAVLIENAVVGQVVFVIDTAEFSLVNDRGRVVDVMVTIHKPNYSSQSWQVSTGIDQFIQLMNWSSTNLGLSKRSSGG